MACAPTPTPGPAPTSEPTPSPSAIPTPTLDPPAAGGIVISTQHIVVVDSSGAELASFDYFQPTAEVVDGLSSYLGSPTDTAFEGHNDAPAATYHDWGGLRLVDTVPDSEPPHFPEHWVSIAGPEANGLVLRAVDGTVVGDAIAGVTGEYTDFTNPSTGLTSRWVRIDLVALPLMGGSDGLNFATAISGSLDDDRVERILAPSANFGA